MCFRWGKGERWGKVEVAVTLSWRDSKEGIGAGNGLVMNLVMVRNREEKRENVLNAWPYPTECFNFGCSGTMKFCEKFFFAEVDLGLTIARLMYDFFLNLNDYLTTNFCGYFWFYDTRNLADFQSDFTWPERDLSTTHAWLVWLM
jgi:hypothetical protein